MFTLFVHFRVTPDMVDNPVDKLFKYLISMENDTVRSKIINIMGRNVDFKKACGQILDSTFSELCERVRIQITVCLNLMKSTDKWS